jgi:hypothetical protein
VVRTAGLLSVRQVHALSRLARPVYRRRVLERLLRSKEPSLRFKARSGVLREDTDSRSMEELRKEVRNSSRARALVRRINRPGRKRPPGIYHKWLGDHWVLASLADLGYPASDNALLPLAEQVTDFWLGPAYFREFEADTEREGSRVGLGVPRLQGRYRRCASQQGNALFACTTLDLVRENCAKLAERLRHWQWPDGGWNCDRTPSADTSSFEETLTPMRGLFEYGNARSDSGALAAAGRASEVFLSRRLYKRATDGTVIRGAYRSLHYPLYYHYDVLGALRALSRMGRLGDPRCRDALDLLESKELETGGWPATQRFYDLPGETPRKGQERVLWGGNGNRMNEWVTVDVLSVLVQAGRFAP